MRTATTCTFLTVLFACVAPLAQTPDTTSAWRYFPLHVGNVWEYEHWLQDGDEAALRGYGRITVVGDTVMPTRIDDEEPVERAYFEVVHEGFDGEGEPAWRYTTWLRFDTTRAMVRESFTETDEPWSSLTVASGCPLDADFSEGDEPTVACETDFGEPVGAVVYVGCDLPVEGGIEAPGKRYVTDFLVYDDACFARDIGLTYSLQSEVSTGWSVLVFARIDGVEHGEPFPVAAEAAPSEAAVALAVYPNPTRDAATLNLTLDRPQRVTLAVYDVLGRRVLADDLGAQPAGEASHRLDAAGLPAGLYVVRLTGDAGASATARVVLQ